MNYPNQSVPDVIQGLRNTAGPSPGNAQVGH